MFLLNMKNIFSQIKMEQYYFQLLAEHYQKE